MDNQEFQQAFKKVKSEFKTSGRISECFYHNKTECKGIIKQSHSIQRSKRLSIIEGDVNGQNVIYTFTEIEYTSLGSIKTLKPIGKKVASTFLGFCEFHDTVLFSDIENFLFDNSDYHCFLHSYRAFAHSYHIKKESLKAYNEQGEKNILSERFMLSQLITGTELAIKDLEITKKKLDELIQNKRYDQLDYFTYILPEKFPIGSSSIINPEYSYKNSPINNNATELYSMIMLTVLPDYDKTIIILACFNDDKKGIMLLDELAEIKYEVQFERAISSLIINNAENTFFSPALWNALSQSGQKQLCKELEYVAKGNPTRFVNSKINFFDKQFSAQRLGV